MLRIVSVAAVLLLAAPARADRCDDVKAEIGDRLADVNCFHTDDLTTNGPRTTLPDGSLPGWPFFAFTPVTDRAKISPSPADKTPITKAVPGIELQARFADDATGEARFLLRLPDAWNGDLVVAGASGTRSEFNGDWAWSDYVIQKGFAYASQNKGVLNLEFTTPSNPLACRLFPGSTLWVHFYDNDPQKPFTEWQWRMVQAGQTARAGVAAGYGMAPRHTYAVGTSNGGYQVRRAVEEAPGIFDGGVDWEGTHVDGDSFNILSDLPPAIRNFPAYVASGYDPGSAAAQAIQAAGYPPDIVNRNASGTVTASLWGNYYAQFWEVTQCQWQKRLDPTYDTYGSGTGTYDYFARAAVTDVEQNLNAFATTGKIKAPLITVAGTMDALLPIKHHARAYADKVTASKFSTRSAYRLYEVQNGNHIEAYRDTFQQLEYLQPHAQKAFDLLVDYVEKNAPLPASQCIPRGGSISSTAPAGRCANLFVP